MVHTLVRSVILSTVTLFGCSQPKQEDAGQKSQPTTPAAAEAKRAVDPKPAPGPEHAAAGVKPGSHEDWCGEHQVPESLCTRCNPSLIAAFKASNDWCVEHDLPESQCKICNPDLKIVRPPPAGEAKP
ncbi:MAG: hypothetical protein JNL82_11570 [Myxococcales bacterium]|nr:hypothetical protein [Myxococcales bacterium]